jgi:hypothetical protein
MAFYIPNGISLNILTAFNFISYPDLSLRFIDNVNFTG